MVLYLISEAQILNLDLLNVQKSPEKVLNLQMILGDCQERFKNIQEILKFFKSLEDFLQKIHSFEIFENFMKIFMGSSKTFEYFPRFLSIF